MGLSRFEPLTRNRQNGVQKGVRLMPETLPYHVMQAIGIVCFLAMGGILWLGRKL